ncbi:MAG: TIGR02757 family protein [Cyclobacteriaceae bacterium]|nr:TIGR02757 family protein [Cyclobacteriaceae bacterium]
MTSKKRQHILGLKDFLDEKVDQFNRPHFIELDPISVPHQYSKKQDIEIAGLLAAVLAWGQRVTVVKKSNELLALMDNSPYEFVLQHQKKDLRRFEKFKHRTFNTTDTVYFIAALQYLYRQHDSLEEVFFPNTREVGSGLIRFHQQFFSLPNFPARTKKHISTPERKSACKRLNMYLRWMVRSDNRGVDFGLWKRSSAAHLICPLDLHVERVARKLRLLTRKQVDWETALELTDSLRLLDTTDPVKYDFALFGLGIEGDF